MAAAPTALGRHVRTADPRLHEELDGCEATLLDGRGAGAADEMLRALTRLHAALAALGLPAERSQPSVGESHGRATDPPRPSGAPEELTSN